MAQSVKRLTSAQVMISRCVSSSPVSGSVLTAQSLEPVSDSVSPSLSAPPPFMLSLPVSKINVKKFFSKRLNCSVLCRAVHSYSRTTFTGKQDGGSSKN